MSDPWSDIDSILFGSTAGAGTTTAAAPPQYRIPSDMTIFWIDGRSAVVGWGIGSQVGIYFLVDDVATYNNLLKSGIPIRHVSSGDFNRHRPINGGSVRELDQVAATHGSWKKYWDWLLLVHLGDNAAGSDPAVQRVMLELAGRPDMSQEELENRLKQTSWWQKHTEAQLVWNDLSPAEKQFRIDEAKARLADAYFQFVGDELDLADSSLTEWATKVASGQNSQAYAVTFWIKEKAKENPESPWSRILRDEEESQRQRPIDIENQGQAVQDLARRWGVQLSDDAATQWGRDMVENLRSDADLLDYLKGQAAVMYPLKDPELETGMWAEAWMQTYGRVMETDVDIFNPEIQRVLQQGVQPWQFERELKTRPEWMNTRNATETMLGEVGQLGSKLGFV